MAAAEDPWTMPDAGRPRSVTSFSAVTIRPQQRLPNCRRHGAGRRVYPDADDDWKANIASQEQCGDQRTIQVPALVCPSFTWLLDSNYSLGLATPWQTALPKTAPGLDANSSQPRHRKGSTVPMLCRWVSLCGSNSYPLVSPFLHCFSRAALLHWEIPDAVHLPVVLHN